MTQLLSKDLKLAASPLSYGFLAFSLMTLLPGYPILVGPMFVCLGIFYSFQNAREVNDSLYSVLLPVDRAEVVRAKYRFVTLLQLIAFGIMLLLTVLRMTVLWNVPVYLNNVMMPANPVFLAWTLLIYAAFHRLFVDGFYRTAYGLARPFLGFIFVAILMMGVGELLFHIAGLEFLGDRRPSSLLIQCGILAVAALIYGLTVRSSCRRSAARFDELDF